MKNQIGFTVAEIPRTLLAFLPSSGLGGGIERYCSWMLEAAEESGVKVVRVVLLNRGESLTLVRKLRFVSRCAREARRARLAGSVGVVVCHPNLAVASLLAVRSAGLRRTTSRVLFYGVDIWSAGRMAAYHFRRSRSELITISEFSAGALVFLGNSQVLAPGLRRKWYETLVQSERPHPLKRPGPFRILTVFRLDDADNKGLPQLVDAVERVRKGHRCHLTVAGSSALPADLQDRITNLPWVSVVTQPSDEELSQLYAAADVFVLATRTRTGLPSSGEGFGIVLIEAQLTGTPVVAPAFGGSDDAFLAGITGVKPGGESAGALADVLQKLVADPALLRQLGENAKVWSRTAFDPDRRIHDVQSLLLGRPTATHTMVLPVAVELTTPA